MARKKQNADGTEETGADEVAEGLTVLDPAEWLQRVMNIVCESNPMRQLLPATEYEILAAPDHAAGLDPIEAADRLIKEMDAARGWMLTCFAKQAHFLGWQPGTRLEYHGSMPPNWVTDMMRHSLHEMGDYFFRYVVDKEGKNYPMALPASPYREYFAAHEADLVNKFMTDFKKI